MEVAYVIPGSSSRLYLVAAYRLVFFFNLYVYLKC